MEFIYSETLNGKEVNALETAAEIMEWAYWGKASVIARRYPESAKVLSRISEAWLSYISNIEDNGTNINALYRVIRSNKR